MLQTVGERPFQDTSEARAYYLEHLEDNLYLPMSAGAKAAYGGGSGNEIESGKMNALRSSSAMTYNLLWDQIAEIPSGDEHVGSGIYQVEFEKQYHTLLPKASRQPANLDAFLYCKHTKEAVACEMKMTEWLFNKPGNLRAAYLAPDNYPDMMAGKAFTEAAKNLIRDGVVPEKKEYEPTTVQYDAFQMFKHTAACYMACVREEPRKIEKLTLVNCVWTIRNPQILPLVDVEWYLAQEKTERTEFEQFKQAMTPIMQLFADQGIRFDICLYTFGDFLRLLRKTPEELAYLQRYMLEEWRQTDTD